MRTFIAIDLDEAVRRDLGRLIQRLSPRCGDLRWSRPDTIHLTLKFLGEASDDQIMPICGALRTLAAQCQPFDIDVRGAGCFPDAGSVRVVWAGVHDFSGMLARCQSLCEELVAPLGFPTERRPFSPHLTLARNKSPALSADIRRAVLSEVEFSAGVQTVSAVTLYQSTLTSQGSTYQPLCTCPFVD
ncbi:MAG: RNA 2',3'-cyclic phosphodiesterase [Planctomycetota bacterium]|nr:MAG: RNA 2',3'-cyclic phosphodiesterase [Planctomycetota bacterium]